jgi:hypothetical protein
MLGYVSYESFDLGRFTRGWVIGRVRDTEGGFCIRDRIFVMEVTA